MKRSFCLTLLAATALLAACGGDDEGERAAPDLARMAPVGTAVYAEGFVRPRGEMAATVEALIARIGGIADPGARLIRELDESAAEDETAEEITYSDDIEPWLGERAAFLVQNFRSDPRTDDPPMALLVETTDAAAAEDFLRAAREPQYRDRSYRGVSYQYDPEERGGLAVVDGVMVFATEETFHDIVDITRGEAALAGQAKFADPMAEAEPGSFVDMYLDMDAVLAAIVAEIEPEARPFFQANLDQVPEGGLVASLVPEEDTIELAVKVDAPEGAATGDASDLLRDLPAEAWLAFAAADVGEAAAGAFAQVEEANPPNFDQAMRFFDAIGIDLRATLRAIDDVALFVGGTDRQSLGGALVIRSGQEFRDAFGQLTDLMALSDEPEVIELEGGTAFRDPDDLGPKPLAMVTGDDRAVIAYGLTAAEQVFDEEGSKLAENPDFQVAEDALGGVDVSGFVAMAPILDLVRNLGEDNDPDYREAKPYLEKFRYVVFGSGEEDGFITTKFVVGLTE